MTDHLTSFKKIANRRLLISILFPFGFLLVSTLLEVLYLNISDTTLRRLYLDPIVSISAQCINFITPNNKVSVHQNALLSGNAYLEVVRTCSGTGVLFLLIPAIAVFSTSLRNKLVGLVFGLLGVVLLNLGRIIGLYFTMVYQPDWFLLIHLYIAPTLMIVLCCLFFAGWAYWASESRHD